MTRSFGGKVEFWWETSFLAWSSNKEVAKMNPTSAAADRMKKRRLEHGRPPNFKLEFPGDSEVSKCLKDKMKQVKSMLAEGDPTRQVTYTTVLETVLDEWVIKHQPAAKRTEESSGQSRINPYTPTPKECVNQPVFLTSKDSVDMLLTLGNEHYAKCAKPLKWSSSTQHGHCVIVSFKCGARHGIRWSSSPSLPNGKFLANYRFLFGYLASGMLPSHYERLCDGAHIAKVSPKFMDVVMDEFTTATKIERNSSIENTLVEELLSSDEIEGAITIQTDARHGWRKNSKQTDVVAIGDNTHKVLNVEIVTREDDRCSQRHELIGTKRLYEYFDTCMDGAGVHVKMHVHDAAASVNAWLRKDQPNTINQNETWHGGKAMEKAMKLVASGAKKHHGTKWHSQLSDKVQPLRTHFHWAMRNCDGSAEKLRQMLDNVVDHYQNKHTQCDATSRCRKDPNYELSRITLTEEPAIRMLEGVIKKAAIYKNAENFVHAKDTFYVESFNNSLNMFHDKRIVFYKQYKMRTDLTICHWNENVDRPYTSIYSGEKVGTRSKGKKYLTPQRFQYRTNIFSRIIDQIYQ
jgi:hypothetical protein